MTTHLDSGTLPAPTMLRCDLNDSGLYPTLVLALRDMRAANGRDPLTGEGDGNESWIGLTLGLIILDTLTGDSSGGNNKAKFEQLLADHGAGDDRELIYRLRCSLHHEYGLPKPSDVGVGGRRVLLTADRNAFAVDTSQPRVALVSVPVFCGRLVERIAAAAWEDWDTSLLDTHVRS